MADEPTPTNCNWALAVEASPKIAAALARDEIDGLLDPAAYTGLAGPFVDRVVREARRLNA